jgi:glucose-1-phosphate thymidylyltransferase
MKALLLAAGYATRLYPLTRDRAKALLPLAGRPMLDWIADGVDEVEAVEELHVVTNARFAAAVESWADAREGRLAPIVHDDGTTSNDDRLGAIGDVAFVVDRGGLAGDDLLVVAGDNLFEFSLADYVAWWRGLGRASAIAVRDCGSLELARQYAVVTLGPDGRVLSFVEKPEHPTGTLVAVATYVYHRDHVPAVGEYLAGGNPPDAPGNFVAWLHSRRPVYGYALTGEWYDVGDRSQLLEADNWLRRGHGLAERDEYLLDT